MQELSGLILTRDQLSFGLLWRESQASQMASTTSMGVTWGLIFKMK